MQQLWSISGLPSIGHFMARHNIIEKSYSHIDLIFQRETDGAPHELKAM